MTNALTPDTMVMMMMVSGMTKFPGGGGAKMHVSILPSTHLFIETIFKSKNSGEPNTVYS